MGYPTFAVGDVLAANDMNAVGLWKITDCTVTSVGGTAATVSNGTITIGNGNTSVTVSNVFSSNFENYRIIATGGGASQAENIRLQLGASNTGYYNGGEVYNYVNGGSAAVFDNNAALFTRAGIGTTNAIAMDVHLFSPNMAKTTGYQSWYLAHQVGQGGFLAGFHNVATAYTAFTISPNAGSFTGGTIRIYGYRN